METHKDGNAHAYPLIEAHRGDSSRAPENTMAAFRLAVDAGAHSIECDVRDTADGELVVMHDADTLRTCGVPGRVADMPAAALRRLTVTAGREELCPPERVPYLTELVEMCRGTGTGLNIELKALRQPEGIRKLAELIGSSGAGADWPCVISSFDIDLLQAARRVVGPTVWYGLIGGAGEILPVVLEFGLEWMHANHRTVGYDDVVRAHANGVRVMIWTMDEPARFAGARRMGIDNVCTNVPARMGRAAAAVGAA